MHHLDDRLYDRRRTVLRTEPFPKDLSTFGGGDGQGTKASPETSTRPASGYALPWSSASSSDWEWTANFRKMELRWFLTVLRLR